MAIEKDRVGEIFEMQRAFMFGVAFNHTLCPEDAEDVVQNAGMRMLSQQCVPQDERGFAYTLVDHEAHDYLDQASAAKRDRSRTDSWNPDNPLHHPVAPSAEDVALRNIDLASILGNVSPLLLMHAAGFTDTELSEKMSLHIDTVDSRIRDERKRLRRLGERIA